MGVSLGDRGAIAHHGDFVGLEDDDHLQYLLLLGRTGGQAAIGGLGVSDELTLKGSSDSGLGIVRTLSPFIADKEATFSDLVMFEGLANRQPSGAGVYQDLHYTPLGDVDVDGLAITDLDALRLEALSVTLSGGTVTDASGLHVVGQAPDSLADAVQALRVTGRTRIDGAMNFGSASLSTLTADVAALALPVDNAMRHVILLDADALGPWDIQGIVAAQDEDSFYIINTGSNAFELAHEDTGASAADRIISPTGVNIVLDENEVAYLWYDSAASRWRILQTTGG